jgi:hypothetical protein
MADSRPQPRRVRRAGSLLLAICMVLAAPMMSVASAASEPISLGEWMAAIFGGANREVDPSQKGLGVAPPPLPTPQLQTASEPASPKEPGTPSQVPRFWIRREPVRHRRRRRR